MSDSETKVTLKDGTVVSLRKMGPADRDALLAFYRKLPEEDRHFLRDDVTDPAFVDRVIRELDFFDIQPIVAMHEEEIVGTGVLTFSRRRWTRHVGDIRCVVAREYQGKGLGTTLASQMFDRAVQAGLEMIQAQMAEDQVGVVKAFSKMGFKKVATLPGFIKDYGGTRRNLVIMVADVNEIWARMRDAIHRTDTKVEHLE